MLRKKLNQGSCVGEARRGRGRGCQLESACLTAVGSLTDPAVVCDRLDALTVNLNGKARRAGVLLKAAAGHAPRPGQRRLPGAKTLLSVVSWLVPPKWSPSR